MGAVNEARAGDGRSRVVDKADEEVTGVEGACGEGASAANWAGNAAGAGRCARGEEEVCRGRGEEAVAVGDAVCAAAAAAAAVAAAVHGLALAAAVGVCGRRRASPGEGRRRSWVREVGSEAGSGKQ